MRWLVIAVTLIAASSTKAAENDIQIPCVVYSNTKAATAGVIQVAISGTEAQSEDGYDAHEVAVKLADDKARTCRFGGSLKLADRFLATYQIITGAKDCLLLVELGSKHGALHDRKGKCAAQLCGNGLTFNGMSFTLDAKTKTCAGQRLPLPPL